MLGPVERARVGQLQNHDVDRPLSPGARATCLNFQKFDIIVSGLTVTRLLFITLFLTKAAQRGIGCTKTLLEMLMEGIPTPAEGQLPLTVVDLITGRRG